MDHARALGRLGARRGTSTPAIVFAGREERAPTEQVVRRVGDGGERRLADAVHLAHVGAVFGRARGDLGLDVDRHRGGAGIAAAASASTFSPVLSTTSVGLVVRQNTGARRVRSPFAEPGLRRAASRPASAAYARSSAATSAPISLSPLFAARRWRLSRCSTLARSAITNSSSSASRSPAGSASTPPSSNARNTTEDRVAVAQRAEHLARPGPHRAWNRAGARGARARSPPPPPSSTPTSPPAGRAARREGVAIPTAASYSLGAGRPVSALNRRLAPAPVKPTRPRFSIGAQATDRVACLPFDEQEDQEAQDQGPPQQGQPRQAPPRRPVTPLQLA